LASKVGNLGGGWILGVDIVEVKRWLFLYVCECCGVEEIPDCLVVEMVADETPI
jgi:hypothetical protein